MLSPDAPGDDPDYRDDDRGPFRGIALGCACVLGSALAVIGLAWWWWRS